MARFLIRRLGVTLLLLWLAASLIFLMIHMVPGDAANVILGEDNPSPERAAALRAKLGLDQPLSVQYTHWVGRMMTGDMGNSLLDDRPIARDIANRLPRSLELAGMATILGVAAGIPAGIWAAVRRGRADSAVLSSLSLLGLSAPAYIIGSLLILLFGVKARWLPAGGFVGWDLPGEHLLRLILPTITLALGVMAVLQRMTRSSLLEVLGMDYVRVARAKGLRERTVIFRHALRNALVPVVAAIGVQLGTLLGSTVIVEAVFNWPGVSSLLVKAITQRDYPMVQAIVLVVVAAAVLVNWCVDLFYAMVDPRIRYQ